MRSVVSPRLAWRGSPAEKIRGSPGTEKAPTPAVEQSERIELGTVSYSLQLPL